MKPRCAELPKQKAKGLCRWCGKPVPRGSRTWCSDACVEQYKIRAWPGHARYRVEQRDNCVCGLCGLDLKAVARSINRQIRKYPNLITAQKFVWSLGLPSSCIRGQRGQWGYSRGHQRAGLWSPTMRVRRRKSKRQKMIERCREYPGIKVRGLWQADHIVPVSEGGGSCGLENLRTLCRWCHAIETAKLRRRLNRKKRKQQELFCPK